MKNMMRPQTKATAIHTNSPRATGSFHQMRVSGGLIAMTGSYLRFLFDGVDQRNLDELHDPPQDVDDGRRDDADEEQQKRIVENALHEGHVRHRFRLRFPF